MTQKEMRAGEMRHVPRPHPGVAPGLPLYRPGGSDEPAPQPFQAAQAVLHACELAVARGRPAASDGTRPRFVWLTERSLSIELVLRAGQPSIRTFFAWLGLFLLGAALAYGALKPSGWISDKDLNAYFQILALFLTLCFVLSRPSAHGFPGWHASDLQYAKQRCSILPEMGEADLDAVQYFVDHAIAGTRRRVSALWWLTGATWAIAAYLAQKGLDAKDGNMLGFALLPTICAAFGAGLIALYARSIDHVHGLARALLFDQQSALKNLMQMREARKWRRARRPQL